MGMRRHPHWYTRVDDLPVEQLGDYNYDNVELPMLSHSPVVVPVRGYFRVEGCSSPHLENVIATARPFNSPATPKFVPPALARHRELIKLGLEVIQQRERARWLRERGFEPMEEKRGIRSTPQPRQLRLATGSIRADVRRKERGIDAPTPARDLRGAACLPVQAGTRYARFGSS